MDTELVDVGKVHNGVLTNFRQGKLMGEVNNAPTRLFRLSMNLAPSEWGIVTAAGMRFAKIYWCDGITKTLLGGYRGNFRETYQSLPGHFSPTGKEFKNLPMRYFEEVR